jgi:hypothetical protein
MQQIADRLTGMPEYAQRFAENRVDFSVLRDPTDRDLKEPERPWRPPRRSPKDSAGHCQPRRQLVTEMGGQVAKKLGDGPMAVFGYPVAQENDARRAVRAALAIQRALAEVNRKNAGAGRLPAALRLSR